MAEQLNLNVLSPPDTPEIKSYYFIYGEWNVVVEGSKVVSPNGQPQADSFHRIGMNEVIAMHPAIFTVLIQQTRPGYTVRSWGGISRELFLWWKEVERLKKAAMEAANAQG